MMKSLGLAVGLALGAGVALSAASANAVVFVSGPGGGGQTCYGNTGSSFTGLDAAGNPQGLGAGADCVQITPHPAWKSGDQANIMVDDNSASTLDPHPVWISYADTGYGGSTLATPTGNTDVNQPNMIITQSFHLGSGGLASLRQWADDTVKVYVDGVGLSGADIENFTQNTCANGPPGCQPGESSFGQVFLNAGDHVFTWEVWQVGTGQDTTSNPFGLLYAGQVAVPEPATIALFGFGLLGLGVASRRRRPS